jgi:hypothetical protein
MTDDIFHAREGECLQHPDVVLDDEGRCPECEAIRQANLEKED